MTDTAKNKVIEILTSSFQDNKSTNYLIKQDSRRKKRFRKLIEYSIFYGEHFGEIFLAPDNSSCYILIDSEKKKTTFKSLFWDVRLVLSCIGVMNLKKVLKRESLIKAEHKINPHLHLWYIGVSPDHQGKGLGTSLMEQVKEIAKKMNKTVYLETSTERNFDFYKSVGFKEIATVDELSYTFKVYSFN